MKYTVKNNGLSDTNQKSRELSFPNIPNQETRSHVESVVANNPARALFRGATQIGSGLLGGAGNLASLATSGVNLLQQPFTGKDIPGYETAQKYLPTSRNIVRGTEKLTAMDLGGSVESESPLDRFLSNASSLVSGGFGLKQAAKIAGAGQVARSAAKASGAGELGQSISDIGGSLIAGKLTSPNIRKKLESIREDSYKNADKLLPKNATGDAAVLRAFIDETMDRGSSIRTKSDAIVKKPLAAIASSIDRNNSTLSINQAIKDKKKINEIIRDLYSSHESPKGAIDSLKKTVGSLNDFIQQSTESNHPDFWKNWKIAEDLSRGLAPIPRQAQSATSEIANMISKNGLSSFAGYLIGGKLGSIAAPVLLKGIQSAFKKSKEFRQLVNKSPVAKEQYKQALGALAMGNSGLALKNISDLANIDEDRELNEVNPVYRVKSI